MNHRAGSTARKPAQYPSVSETGNPCILKADFCRIGRPAPGNRRSPAFTGEKQTGQVGVRFPWGTPWQPEIKKHRRCSRSVGVRIAPSASAGVAGLSGASFWHSPAIVVGGKPPRALSFYVKQATRKTAEQARPHLIEYRAWFSDFVGRNTPT